MFHFWSNLHEIWWVDAVGDADQQYQIFITVTLPKTVTDRYFFIFGAILMKFGGKV
jgi:hypothetical protein